MSEASSPVREGSYKLRTHSNCNFMFSRSLIQPHSERIYNQGDNAMLLKFEDLNQSIPLIGLLSKPHCKLSDGMTIYNQVKKYSFFQELFNSSRLKNDMEQIYHLCTKLQLEVFKQGTIILKEGAISNDKMYLIIEGRVLIFKQQYSIIRQQMKGQQTVSKTELHSDILQNYMQNYGCLINDLNSGNYFGEKALMENNRDAQRSATCIADIDTYLISLNRNEFFEVLGSFKKDAEFKREVFQSVIPYFERITSTLMIESLMYSFNEEIKLRDETVTQEGDQANTFYILFEGEVAIMKKHQNHQMLLCSLHNQQVIGEESLFQDNYFYTVVVHSQQAKFYKISAQSFLLKGSQQCVKGLKNMMEKKQQTRTLLFETIIKKSIEHRETTKKLIRNRNQSTQEEDCKKQYYGITNRYQRKLDTTINRGSSIFSSNQTNQSLNTQNSLKQVTKCLEDYALFQVKFEENKQKRNCFKQSIQYQQLQQKLGINQKTESSSPSKQETEQQKDFSSRTDSIYTMKNKNSLSSRTKSSLIQNFLQFNTVDAMKKKLTNQKKNYLIKSMKQMKDLQLIKIRCQTLEQ
ncbi:unnamed protein product [Paramecium pentaurelia]|uniref:Cyclic nucleotide-binding domain-containing protein n=1 Tax=Paramecium pentaurelia TaxID=43138 RepID=A0A8S1UA45_9CILI|nr:unnamed protein product [Paramecium pentaurelia]